jgi:hypothetical protein
VVCVAEPESEDYLARLPIEASLSCIQCKAEVCFWGFLLALQSFLNEHFLSLLFLFLASLEKHRGGEEDK